MRINTGDGYKWRLDLYDRVGEQLGESTRSGAVDASAEFTEEMLENLEELSERPDLLNEELAEILSTSKVEVEYEERSDLRIDGQD